MPHRFIPGIASQSLGNPQYHAIKPKLEAAASAGLQSVEIFFEDIAQLAKACQADPSVLSPELQPYAAETTQPQFSQEEQTLLACSRQIRKWCLVSGLQIICLQPFMHYEGTVDPQRRDANIEKLHLWINIAKNLGTDLIQIPSSFLSSKDCTGDRQQLVDDLRTAAQIGAQQTPIVRFAYEALCWGTHINTWDAAWDLVRAVDMDNFGTCLDTFNIAGRVFADPARTDGRNVNADADIATSIQKLRQTFSDPENLKKVFYVELCDGEMLDFPISSVHEWYNSEQPARMTWSRNARLYPFETDVQEACAQRRGHGYLPATEIFDVLLDVGYEGFVSFEVFNRSLNKPGSDVIVEHTERVRTSWQRCQTHIDHFFHTRHQALERAPERKTWPANSSRDEQALLSIQPRL